MADDVKTKRRYDASRRQEMARQTQRDVLDAARRLFVAQGYVTTTVRQIADEAGVSLQTIYTAFGNKAGVFDRLADVTVAGDDEPLSLRERPEMRALYEETDADRLVDGMAAATRRIWSDFGDLLPVMRSAAENEPQLEEARRVTQQVHRYGGQAELIHRLADLGALDPRVPVQEAVDVYWTLAGPEVYELLVLVRGWTPERYEAWLNATVRATLLAARPAKRRRR